MTPVTYRPAGIEDSYPVYQIFETAVADLAQRLYQAVPGRDDPAQIEKFWSRRRALFEHLARSAEGFWLAEADGQPVGYARSILRDGLRELTEFFVLPGSQSGGVGRELLRRVFPAEGAERRAIIATQDLRALARYLKAGVYARFPIYSFSRPPRAVTVPPGLAFEPLTGSDDNLAALREVDRAVLGHTRDVDHRYWLEDRAGFLVRRGREVVGYGYTGYDGGPFALLDEADIPAALAYAERAVTGKVERFHLEVPLINRRAVDHLLSNGYELNPFNALFMSDEPFGKFENYILPAPPFTL